MATLTIARNPSPEPIHRSDTSSYEIPESNTEKFGELNSGSTAENQLVSALEKTEEGAGVRQFLSSKPVSLAYIVWMFCRSRTIFSITPIIIAIACRLAIPKPFRWFEIVLAIGILLCWPVLEFMVHYTMHHVQWTGMYRRHKHHHENPTSVESPYTYLFYNLLPVPWLFLQWRTPETILVMLLSMVMIYEFIHFSVHFRYRPLTAWGKRVRKNHMLHHRDPMTRLELVFPRKD